MMSPQPTNFLRTAYDRCDALLHLAEDEDSLLVAANETGRQVFERLFVLPVDWEKDWSRLALPTDWKAIGISVGGILIGGGPGLAQVTTQELTLDRDIVRAFAHELANDCRVIVLEDGEFEVIRREEMKLH
jgi:hypothetical protein